VLAREALALWPDCADGYVLLAQAASSLDEARELLERGVVAGERAVGRRVFVEDAGDFWLIFETRPYMRARAALAATLWRLGRREEAVCHQRELLRLNPRDNRLSSPSGGETDVAVPRNRLVRAGFVAG